MKKSFILMFFVFAFSAKGQISKEDNWLDLMNDPEVNFYDVVDAFETEWDGKTIQKGRGWKQFKRWEALWNRDYFHLVSVINQIPYSIPTTVLKQPHHHLSHLDWAIGLSWGQPMGTL
jgi:hypothetical protein